MLSGETTVANRQSYHRLEGDKLRLLWSYFQRQCRRSEFSKNVFLNTLKQKYIIRRTPSSLALQEEEAWLPMFPNGGMDLDVESISSGDEGPPPLPPLPPPAADPPSVDWCLNPLEDCAREASAQQQFEKNASYALFSSVLEDPIVGAARPDVVPQVVRCTKRPWADGPGDVSGAIAALQAMEPSDHRGHMRAVTKKLALIKSGVLKRPAAAAAAAAAPGAAAAAAPAAAAPAAPGVLKRPAAFPGPGVLKRPAAAAAAAVAPAVAAVAPVVAAGLASDIGQPLQTHKVLLLKCVEACEDAPRPAGCSAGKVVASFQRGTRVFQIQDMKSRKMVCMTSDKQFGCAEEASRAADVLAELYTLGCTSEDLQRCKLKGALGVTCGVQKSRNE